ncbi:hypothetical protein CNEO2_90052 [Clostridium neonatale]|nr:hypothetical protein CNEO2_110040 [Clostridium neonatale]CAI3196892.1 hypothetical protein CNEO2_150038 [Clostridium neonatale]CAI3217753.1 hypothetical protein CNEO2_100040 [Clostridium neonatale]CAI3567900.1 hypothetical protein CNEO2_120038 [Clostridium neonatale]CAI3586703.1 hypothetical protein CNEO4_120051 [Clostridium neonatale]
MKYLFEIMLDMILEIKKLRLLCTLGRRLKHESIESPNLY